MLKRSLASRWFLSAASVSFALACGDNTDSGSSAQGGNANANSNGGASTAGVPSNGGVLASNASGGSMNATGGRSDSAGSTNGGSSSTSGGTIGTGGSNLSGGAGGKTDGGTAGTTNSGGKTNGGTAGAGGTAGSNSGGNGGTRANGGSSANAGNGGTAGKGGTAGSSANAGTTSSGGTAGAGAGAGGAGNGTAPVKIWIAGDSTVQTCSSACPCGWGGQFVPLFIANVTVQNSAVGGRSVQTWLYDANVSNTMTNGECALSNTAYNARWTAMTNTSTGMKSGDYLFIQFGINDGDRTCPRHVGLTLFKTYLGAMAKAAKDRGAHPIFLTPVSAISCNSSGKAVGTRGDFVTATIEAGTTYGVPVIDLHQLSVDLYNSLGFCPNNSDYTTGKVGAFFCEDHTHFESAGAQQIAKVIAKALRDQNIALAAYLL
jgi:lysophospholipase L1-like esterase